MSRLQSTRISTRGLLYKHAKITGSFRPFATTTKIMDKPKGDSIETSSNQETHFGFRSVPTDIKESLGKQIVPFKSYNFSPFVAFANHYYILSIYCVVASVFSNVASKYDIMNDAMSGGIHRLWKDTFIRRMMPCPGAKLLDVAGGTGTVI